MVIYIFLENYFVWNVKFIDIILHADLLFLIYSVIVSLLSQGPISLASCYVSNLEIILTTQGVSDQTSQ